MNTFKRTPNKAVNVHGKKVYPADEREMELFRRVRLAGSWTKAWEIDPVARQMIHDLINEVRRDLGQRETTLAEEMEPERWSKPS
jgi:hypothetical protein